MDKSNSDKSSSDLLNFDHKREDVIENGRKIKGIREDLGDDKERLLIDNNKNMLKIIKKKDKSDYFERIRRYSLLII